MPSASPSYFHTCALSLLLIAGCGGSQGSDSPVGGGGSPGTIGPRGGVVSDDSGAQVIVPEGALQSAVAIGVAQATEGFALLPTSPLGAVYALTPHGTEFALPVTIRIPHDAGRSLGIKLYTSQPGSPWTIVDTAVFAEEYAEAQLNHFSYVYNGADVCGQAYQECCTGAVEPCAGDLLRCDSQLNACLPQEPPERDCGLAYQPCCEGANACTGTLVCDVDERICLPCGFQGDACCANDVCRAGSVCGTRINDSTSVTGGRTWPRVCIQCGQLGGFCCEGEARCAPLATGEPVVCSSQGNEPTGRCGFPGPGGAGGASGAGGNGTAGAGGAVGTGGSAAVGGIGGTTAGAGGAGAGAGGSTGGVGGSTGGVGGSS